MSLATDVIDHLNTARAAEGLLPLTTSKLLMQTAQQHAEFMDKTQALSHMGQNRSTFDQRIKAAGYVFSVAAENIALGALDAAGVVTLWMGSPPHRANILKKQITELGIGIAPEEDSRDAPTISRYWSLSLAAPLAPPTEET